ncbi:MAG: penicillin-binding protein [Cyanobacteria bacterium]|nr:penicillin-binding protein [Cyanobacteria bacterium CG_2015-16_32_12]NCO77293.1 penicillin-binding protein [Cyanobacteria bacterium CG_2015-22_32_23]NCQ03817.1 penicillin-binding protein [Cyanobacteria bacterium CG_2015-09_32_10]NCQ40958.1 penicillin-binding protein [Cyanobacteria bacterium CG_2015-04_32_10]NCS86171.1 penicillin-binding protein [Cyanobacteria bacterium CG_2015-02_32_10]
MSSTTINRKTNHQKPHTPKSFLLGIVKTAGGTFLGLTLLSTSAIAGGMVGLAISFRNLPDVRVLNNYVPSQTSYIYDVKGLLLTTFHGEEHRTSVPLNELSPQLKRAVMAIEDSSFYYHNGINPASIARAVVVNFKSGGVTEGASTLTMQLVKNVFLSHQRTFSRKLAEAVLAVRVEQVFSKDQILEMYLNNIYWGHNNYGAETAAQSYFNKSAADLTLPEGAMMAGIIQAPEVYSPLANYDIAKQRQALVLNRMADLGWITPEEAEKAKKTPLKIGKSKAWQSSKLPYVTDAVREELIKRFGQETVIKGGINVQTTIDYKLQMEAEAIVKKAHRNLRASGVRADQVALVSIDPRTHFVKAVVGGIDYEKSQFNRVLQSRRQPGSAFKPFVYYTAFATGKYTPNSVIPNYTRGFREGGGYYRPQNYGGGGGGGSVTINNALAHSLNIPAVVMGQKVGLDKVIEVCRTLGIKSPLQPVVSLPLGPIGVTPMEMAKAYATFANNGWQSETTMIMQVSDSLGNVMLDNTPKPQLVLNEWATASLTSSLQNVINGGTAANANIGRPAAGKTGTTSGERDVWFVGYVPQLSTAVWIGNDDFNRSLGRGVTGGGYAAPIWRDFMNTALKNEPVKYFPSASQFTKPKP